MSLEGSTPLSQNPEGNTAAAISDVNDIIRLVLQSIKVKRRSALEKKEIGNLSTSNNDTLTRSQSLDFVKELPIPPLAKELLMGTFTKAKNNLEQTNERGVLFPTQMSTQGFLQIHD